MAMTEAEMREKYKIPSHYHYWGKMVNGTHQFSYCDSDIDVYSDGRCTETHMGYNGVTHQFYTSQWPPST